MKSQSSERCANLACVIQWVTFCRSICKNGQHKIEHESSLSSSTNNNADRGQVLLLGVKIEGLSVYKLEERKIEVDVQTEAKTKVAIST